MSKHIWIVYDVEESAYCIYNIPASEIKIESDSITTPEGSIEYNEVRIIGSGMKVLWCSKEVME